MSLSAFVSFRSRFVTCLLTFSRTSCHTSGADNLTAVSGLLKSYGPLVRITLFPKSLPCSTDENSGKYADMFH